MCVFHKNKEGIPLILTDLFGEKIYDFLITSCVVLMFFFASRKFYDNSTACTLSENRLDIRIVKTALSNIGNITDATAYKALIGVKVAA